MALRGSTIHDDRLARLSTTVLLKDNSILHSFVYFVLHIMMGIVKDNFLLLGS